MKITYLRSPNKNEEKTEHGTIMRSLRKRAANFCLGADAFEHVIAREFDC